MASKRRSTRQAETRKRSIYAEPDTDDDFGINGNNEDGDPQELVDSPRKRRKLTIRHKPQTRSKTTTKTSNPSKSKGKRDSRKKAYRRPRRKPRQLVPPPTWEFTGPSDRKIPPWATLPVDILRDILLYAAQPLHEQTTTASVNAAWLLKVARTCTAFAEPALEAFYYSPPILNQYQPHDFLAQLRTQTSTPFINYHNKIRALQIDVRRLAYTATHRGLFDLSSLIAELPQLQHVEILNPMHTPPYRELKIQKWAYPANFFDTLVNTGQLLRTWRWSRDMITEKDPATMYNEMLRLHSSKTFEYLRRLVVCGFSANDSAEPPMPEGGGAVAPAGLATAVAVLPAVQDVSFVSCDMIMEKFLERLPSQLKRLELTNCLEVTSDMLRAYFVKSGAYLEELVLNNNPALDLTFLIGLKLSCPRLKVLKMDLRYYSERLLTNDAEPLYDQLLKADDVPTWPSTLRHLEITQLQKWDKEGAEALFKSLLDSAEELPDLRTLILQTHINIPWRDRAGFRDQWIDRLRRVFLNRDPPPSQYMGSLRQFMLWRQSELKKDTNLVATRDVLVVDSDAEASQTHKPLSHVEISSHKPTGDTDAYSSAAEPEKSAAPRRSRRVAEHQISQASASATPDVESESEDSDEPDENAPWRQEPEKYIQGRCTIVDIRIDNQRPRENQFTDADFLDSEMSGDEDWHEGADEDDDGGYAW